MKNVTFCIILLCGSLSSSLNSQSNFQKRYGSNSKEFEKIGTAVSSPDGGLLFGGYTESGTQGGFDIFIQKLNADGSSAWLKSFGGPDLDVFADLIPAAGGGYLFTGYAVDANDGSFDVVLAKINDAGDLLWWKTYGDVGLETGMALCQLTDGSIVVLGFTLSPNLEPALLRAAFDQNGNFVSAHLTTTTDDIAAVKVIATADGGYLAEIHGGNFISGAPDVLFKYDASHFPAWARTPELIGIQIGESVFGIDNVEATSTGILVASSTNNGFFVTHLNNTGSVAWNKKISENGDKTGLHSFADGTIGVAVLSSNILIKKLSSAGATLDSVVLAAPLLPGFYPDFLFTAGQNLYLYSNLSANDQNDYAIARVTNIAAPVLEWVKTFGETGIPDHEFGYTIASLPDNGFVLAGTKEDIDGENDLWLLKADAQGAVLWEKTYSISNGKFDSEISGSVEVDAAGNIIVLAATDYSDAEFHLIKFTASGDLLFDKVIATTGFTPDFFHAIPLPDGGIAACISLDNDTPTPHPTLYRLNSSGDFIWTKSYNGGMIHDLTVLPDGSLVAAGYKQSGPWLFKADNNGNLLWEIIYTVEHYGVFYSVGLAADGNLFAAGISSNEDETEYRALILKANGNGIAQWLKEFDKGPGGYWQVIRVLPDQDGGACFLGQFLAPPVNVDLLTSIFRFRQNLSQLDANGNLVSEQIFGTDGTYPVGGSADHCPDGTVIFCNSINYGTALQDALVIKTDCTVDAPLLERPLDGILALAPNPAQAGDQISLECNFSGQKNVEIDCFDISGKKLWGKMVQTPAGQVVIDLKAPAQAGVYFLKITDETGAFRMMKLVVH